jgi:hypothetical protein
MRAIIILLTGMLIWAFINLILPPDFVRDGDYCGWLQPNGTYEWTECAE